MYIRRAAHVFIMFSCLGSGRKQGLDGKGGGAVDRILLAWWV